jgi:DNA-binding SARP family transcriptional activator/tetratricopeptide (TPR) repeat protein/TolB-like protein
MIRFRALGSLDLRRQDGQEIRAVVAQPKRVALWTYLTLARPHGFHRRDHLLPMFWPDADDERARAALSRAIYFLRHEVGDVIVSRGDEIAINRERVWCDVSAFEEQCAAGEPREALNVYRGDLLPGFFASSGNNFEEWLDGERNRLRDLASKTAWDVADDEVRAGHPQISVSWGRRAVELAPYQEAGLRRLLLLLEATGDRGGAIFTYEKFAQRLKAELDLSPTPETLDLVAEIRGRNHPVRPVNSAIRSPAPAQHTADPLTVESATLRKRTRQLFAAIAVTAIVVTTPAIVLARTMRPHRALDTISVMPFINRTGNADLDALTRLASERVIEQLTGTGMLHVVSPPRASPLRDTGASAQVRLLAPRSGASRRAGVVVAGEIQRSSGNYHVIASVLDVAAERVVWTIPRVVGDIDSLRIAVDEVSDRATGGIAALASARFASWIPIASSPPTFAAFQEFAHGVELQAHGAHADALTPLRRAVALDSTFVVAQLQLAVAHVHTFEDAADSIARALDRNRSRLTPLQRHWLDWLLSLGAEDLLGGYRALQAAADLAPERFLATQAEWALRLNRPEEARQLLARLGKGASHHGTEYWKLLTRVYHALGDGERELAAARQARARSPERMELLELELIALAGRGRILEARALLDTALHFPRSQTRVPSVVIDMSGLGLWPGRLMVATGVELRAHGHEQAAQEIFAQALAWYETVPPGEISQTIRKEIAKALYSARRWAAAEEAFRALLEEDPTNYVFLGFIGAILARQGDVAGAERIIARFDTLRPTLPRPHAIAGYWQGKISAVLGDRDRAMRGLSECLGPQGRPGTHSDFDFEGMSSLPAFREFIRPKG